MSHTTVDNIIYLRGDRNKRKVGAIDPSRGELGTLVIDRDGDVCEIGIDLIIALVAGFKKSGVNLLDSQNNRAV